MQTIKKYVLMLLVMFISTTITAQKVEYKKGIIKVDGEDYARVEVEKQNFGLTKNFEVFSPSGEKIIIAVVASEFETDKSDNSTLYYRLTFLTANQMGIFKVSSLGQESSFAKLIGGSNIMENGQVNENNVKAFIAKKAASPVIAVNYTPVVRNKNWPLSVKADKNIEQDGKIIGSFKSTGSVNGADTYEVMLPSGVRIGSFSFTGGNNAQNSEVFTAKDNYKRMVPITQKDKILAADASIDKNYFTVKRMVKWLVDNNYL